MTEFQGWLIIVLLLLILVVGFTIMVEVDDLQNLLHLIDVATT